MRYYLIFISAFLLTNTHLIYSQDETPEEIVEEEVIDKKELLKDAGLYFEKENYLAALPIYLKLDELDPNIEYKYKIGICYLSKSDEKQKSIEYLEQVQQQKAKTKGLSYYLGRAYHLNYRFDEAVEFLNLALKSKKAAEVGKETIERLIENCESGKKYFEDEMDITIENIGPPINTEGSEYVPVITADESVMIFTYRGEKSTGGLQDEYAEPDPKGQFFEDVFFSVKLGQTSWSEPERIGDNINIRGHDASLALSSTGQKLFIYKDTKDATGEIYISDLEGYVWSEPQRLDTSINTSYWEGSVSLSADETTLYFASDRPDGQGGRDIYVSTKREDGSWDKAVNLGSLINTPYHDDAPFIHPDGKTLYFSSQGHSNMGGYDIFLSTLQEDGTWSVPENLGYPINTTDDDKYYVVSADGQRGYYSSQKEGGYGQHDIYVVYLGEYAKEHELILIKGQVTYNDEVVEAEIYAEYADDFEPYEGYFKSNSATGKYIVILPAASNYNLSYETEGIPPHIENVNASEITTYMEIVRDIKMYSDDYVHKLNVSGTILAQNGEKTANVTILIASEDGSISKQVVSDEMGYFSFDQLPGDKNYMFSLTEDINAVIDGRVLAGEKPKEGVSINKIMTNQEGVFSVEFALAPEVTTIKEEETVPEVVVTEEEEPEEKEPEEITIATPPPADVIYKVQVAACGQGENYNTDHLADLGKIEIVSIGGIRRLTVGGTFQSLEEAAVFKQKVIKLGTKDAFITAVENSNRKYLFEIHDKYPDISRQADKLGLNEVIVPRQ
ncbi:MAG: hypothetical protein COC01_09765 [Bacteroidetes bacterium]|nr:MAG: hypothetical protein COC01_09765 [Bacteroidota bacterium]